MELFVDIKRRLPGFQLNIKFTAGRQAIGLLGASGAGKTMTLRCIAGIERPDSGRIVLNGQVLYDSEKGIDLPPQKRNIGLLFQNYALFPNMTVEKNIAFGLDHLGKRQRKEAVKHQIEMMRLEGMEKRYPAQLSGGQQQRVALARALATEPDALLLDEPFSALDSFLRVHLIKQMKDILNHYQGVALFVTHNMEDIHSICSKLVLLSEGEVEASGSRESIFAQPPSLSSAMITGCKNISAARVYAPGQVEALDWGLKLKANAGMCTEEIHHVGIRDISPALGWDKENVFSCWPSFVSETPSQMTVYLSMEKQPSSVDDYHLQWDMPKRQWLHLKDQPLPWKVCLKPEKLILVS